MECRDRLSAGHRPLGRAHPLTSGPRPLVPLGEYDWPSLPTDQTLRRAWNDLVAALRPAQDDSPLVEHGRLDRETGDRLDALARGPATASAEADLAAEMSAWRDGDSSRLQVVIVPPCAPRDPVAAWAEASGLPILPPPPRHLLTDRPGPPAPDLGDGDGPLVIPRLEDWMLRHEDGLDTLRALLAALGTTERRAVIGCGSWAWAYLSKAVEIDLALPSPRTFAPHDGERLRDWFADLSQAERARGTTFRLASDGAEVFGEEHNGESHFRRLAATSLGIPWIAWTIWRASLRGLHPTEEDDAEEAKIDAARDDVETVWIVDPTPPSQPSGHERAAHLALHALLLHGPLDAAMLDRLLPGTGSGPLVAALVSAGVLLRDGAALTLAPAAYPDVRRALVNAGFPQDRL